MTLKAMTRTEYDQTYKTAPPGTQSPNFRHTGALWVQPRAGDDRVHYCVRSSGHEWADPVYVASAETADAALAVLRAHWGDQL